MAVPIFHQFFRPTLEVLKDRQPRHWRAIQSAVADAFGLSPEDRDELLPSQQRTRVADRVQWALTYLRQARLVETTGRGINRITSRGLEYLPNAPEIIRPSDLMAFSEFVEFQRRSRPDTDGGATADENSRPFLTTDVEPVTPEEAIEAAFGKLNTALAQEVLDRVKGMSPAFFERLIVRLMLRLGYGGATEEFGYVLGKTGDGGVDGVINQDKLGLEKIYLQAKRWADASVGVKEIQAFVGALDGQGASKGVFMTTSAFSRDAMDYAKRVSRAKISLVDGLQLAKLMIEHDLGVSLVQRYDVKRVDSDFFAEE
jgi:restriction system protein